MLVWLTLPFYDFCSFRSVAVNSVYKLQFFYIYMDLIHAEGSRGGAVFTSVCLCVFFFARYL